jgi:hypothetical protein
MISAALPRSRNCDTIGKPRHPVGGQVSRKQRRQDRMLSGCPRRRSNCFTLTARERSRDNSFDVRARHGAV